VNNNYNSNTVVKQDNTVVKQVDGRAAHMTDTTLGTSRPELMGGMGGVTPPKKSQERVPTSPAWGPRNAGIAELIKY
jgi:hypothetical protein